MDYLFISFQIHRDFSAQLEERDFTHFGVILGREDAFFSIEQALLCLTHFDTGQISQEITLFGYLVILFGGYQVLAFQVQQAEVVTVCLPQVAQVGTQGLLYLLAFQLGVADGKAGIALFAPAVSVEDIETDGDASAESPMLRWRVAFTSYLLKV